MKLFTILLIIIVSTQGCFFTEKQADVPVNTNAKVADTTERQEEDTDSVVVPVADVQKIVISNFKDCVNSGFAIMESYPRKCTDGSGKVHVEDIGNTLDKQDLIKVTSPTPNQEVVGQLVIKGEARGSWFFEAEFPVVLKDPAGNRLGATIAVAQSEWTTNDFVPFEAVLEVHPQLHTEGVLYLQKSNPTGDASYDDALEIPLSFPEEYITVQVHFVDTSLSENSLFCDHTADVSRSTAKIKSVARFALEQLFAGPSYFEKVRGYTTSINSGVTIKSLTVDDRVAYVDLSDEAQEGVAGSCWVTSIRAQIEATLKQFPSVDSVVISVDGEVDEALQP